MFQRICLFICFAFLLVPLAHAQMDEGVFISEVYYDAVGDDSQEEWVEIVNVGSAPVALARYKLGDAPFMGGAEGMMRFPAEAVIGAQEVQVVAQTAVGFYALYNRNPTYEIQESDPTVPNMRPYRIWADGDMALNNDGDEVLLLDKFDLIVDSMSYGESDFAFSPSVPDVVRGLSLARTGCDTDNAGDWSALDTPAPFVYAFACEIVPTPFAEGETIGAIQGEGVVSPKLHERVTFEGVVTAVLEDRNSKGLTFYTLFVQDEGDNNVATSDGIAVFLGRERPLAQQGDRVRVTGQVTEFFGLTEIDDDDLEITVLAHNQPLPNPIGINPPATADNAYFEPLEGMLVTIEKPRVQVVGATYAGCAFSVLAEGQGRVFRRSATDPIGHILPILHTSDVDCGGFPIVKSGDWVQGVVGPLTYHFDQFKIVATEPILVDAVSAPELPSLPTVADAHFTIASLNVENHFDDVDDTGNSAEPKPSIEEVAHKQAKLAHVLDRLLLCPTMVGIQEIETAALLQALADETACAYTPVHLPSPDARGIDVALLVDSTRVQLLDYWLERFCSSVNTGIIDPQAHCPDGQQPLFSRPPLVAELMVDGNPMTIVVNHWKSKRGGEAETAVWRLTQAQSLAQWVAHRLQEDPQANIVVLGDFNDYEQSPPLITLASTGLTNVLLSVPDEVRYSFVFSGVSQLIDGVFVSPALLAGVQEATILHTNADYPDTWLEDSQTLFKATDHDIPLVVIAMTDTLEEVATQQPIIPTETPQPVPQANPQPPTDYWLLWVGAVVGLVGGFFLLRK